jgi:hypothetical protein
MNPTRTGPRHPGAKPKYNLTDIEAAIEKKILPRFCQTIRSTPEHIEFPKSSFSDQNDGAGEIRLGSTEKLFSGLLQVKLLKVDYS